MVLLITFVVQTQILYLYSFKIASLITWWCKTYSIIAHKLYYVKYDMIGAFMVSRFIMFLQPTARRGVCKKSPAYMLSTRTDWKLLSQKVIQEYSTFLLLFASRAFEILIPLLIKSATHILLKSVIII